MTTISPELALIDSELAATARELLHQPGRFQPASATSEHPTIQLRLTPATTATPTLPATASRLRQLCKTTSVATIACVAVIAAVAITSPRLTHHAPIALSHNTLSRQAAARARATRDARNARNYTWPAVPGAQTYQITIMRDNLPIYESTTTEPGLQLPKSLHLSPGSYTWTATPRFNSDTRNSSARPVIEETFQIHAA